MATLDKKLKIELAKTLSSHWYKVFAGNKLLGIWPSATTILNAYPANEYLTKWIADNGWNESQRIKSDAGRAGTAIHKAIEALIAGQTLNEEHYKLEEWVKISSFVDWYKDYKPNFGLTEVSVASKKHKYAGTVDAIAKINGENYVLDWKSSRNLHKSYPLQFSAYASAIEEMVGLKIDKTAVLQLGTSSKKGYTFKEYDDWRDHFRVFLNVKKTWEYDTNNAEKDPPIINVPSTLCL